MPLPLVGRHRLVIRITGHGRPLSRVAAEAGVARSLLTKWVTRHRVRGPAALVHRSSALRRRPTRLPIEAIELIGSSRREHE